MHSGQRPRPPPPPRSSKGGAPEPDWGFQSSKGAQDNSKGAKENSKGAKENSKGAKGGGKNAGGKSSKRDGGYGDYHQEDRSRSPRKQNWGAGTSQPPQASQSPHPPPNASTPQTPFAGGGRASLPPAPPPSSRPLPPPPGESRSVGSRALAVTVPKAGGNPQHEQGGEESRSRS